MKAQLHARKHGLSQAEFAEFQRMYEQELAGTSRANEVVLPLTTMIKVLGNLSGDGRHLVSISVKTTTEVFKKFLNYTKLPDHFTHKLSSKI